LWIVICPCLNVTHGDASVPAATQPSLEDRVAMLEAQNRELRDEIARLQQRLDALTPPQSKAGGENATLPQTPPVSARLLDKGFHKMDFTAGDASDTITFSLELKNNTGKDIKAVQGIVQFKDQFGDIIESVQLKFEDGISAAHVSRWDGAMKYNQFLDTDRRLNDVDQKNLQTNFVTQKLIFSDGQVQDFAENPRGN
jgi:hypothetical protein